MEVTQIYAIVIASMAAFSMLRTICSGLVPIRNYLSLLLSKYLTYNYLIDRHAMIGPWNAATTFLLVLYLTSNIICLSFHVDDWSHLSRRAGTLSIINLGPLLSGFHLDFLAGLSGLSLKTMRQVHGAASVAVLGLALIHVMIAAATDRAAFRTQSQNPFVLIAGSTLCSLMILSRSIVQKPSYEIFLRTHQGLAILCVYSIWRHVSERQVLFRVYLYVFASVLGLTFLLEATLVLLRSGTVFRGRSRATVTCSCGMIKLRLHLSRPLKIEPGQYVNLWMPSVNFWATLQSHPFVVTSWAATPQTTLDIFIQPRRGFTRDLFHLARRDTPAKNHWVMFSGPHGQIVPVGKYERVMMVADGAGIAAQLPFLKTLIHGYHARQVVTRRIHLVWQISDIDVGIAAQPFLNEALDEDKFESGGILQISIYLDNVISEVSFGTRSTVYPGKADLESLVKGEMTFRGEPTEMKPERNGRSRFRASSQIQRARQAGEYDVSGVSRASVTSLYSTDNVMLSDEMRTRRVPESTSPSNLPETAQDKTLILVSGFARTRDVLRKQARRYLEQKVELFELDFQPFRK